MTPAPFFLRLKNKLKHLGDEKVYTFAVANLCVNEKFHLFYDVDSFMEMHHSDGMMYFTTKHGVQIVGVDCLKINEVYRQFLNFKELYKGDYFWSVPLWLRCSVKFNEKGVVSFAPFPCCRHHYEWFINHFRNKKIYQTWD